MRIAVYSFVLFSLIALCLSLHLYNLQISFIFTYYYSFVLSPIPITLARFYPPFLISLSLSLTQSPLTLSPHSFTLFKSLSLLSVSFLSFLSSLYYLHSRFPLQLSEERRWLPQQFHDFITIRLIVYSNTKRSSFSHFSS